MEGRFRKINNLLGPVSWCPHRCVRYKTRGNFLGLRPCFHLVVASLYLATDCRCHSFLYQWVARQLAQSQEFMQTSTVDSDHRGMNMVRSPGRRHRNTFSTLSQTISKYNGALRTTMKSFERSAEANIQRYEILYKRPITLQRHIGFRGCECGHRREMHRQSLEARQEEENQT